MSVALAETLREELRAAFELHIESIVAASLERIEGRASVGELTERQRREDAVARPQADGYTKSWEKMPRGPGLLVDVATARQHDRGVHRHDHRTFAPPIKINIMFGLILTPVLFAGATQYPWPSLTHLRSEMPWRATRRSVTIDITSSHAGGCVER